MSRSKSWHPTVSRQFLTRNYPCPNCLLKCLQNCLSPTGEGIFSSFKITPAVRVTARQSRDKNCLAAIFASRHQGHSLLAHWAQKQFSEGLQKWFPTGHPCEVFPPPPPLFCPPLLWLGPGEKEHLIVRSEKLQNESFPNFSNFHPEFCPKFCSEFSPKFWRSFRASFRGKRRPEKIHQKPPPFFNAKFPGKSEENITKVFPRAGEVT